MSSSKYLDIAVDLIGRIRSKVYTDRLPSVRQLAVEYNTANQTIFRAIQLLNKHNIVSGSGSRGTLIHPENLPGGGLIGLAVFDYQESLKIFHSALHDLRREITQDGYTPILLGLPRERPPFLAQRLLQADLSGIIFFHSCLTPDICQELDQHNISYISGNIMPGYPQVNFVETNTFELMEQMLLMLINKGYRRIAMKNHSPLEGYSRYCRSQWKKLLRKHNLQPTGFDCFGEAYTAVGSQTAHKLFKKIKSAALPPDVLICWNHTDPAIFSEMEPLSNTLVLCFLKPALLDLPLPGIVRFTCHNDHKLLELELWKILQGLMLEKTGKPIHRYLKTLSLKFADPIPEAADFLTARHI